MIWWGLKHGDLTFHLARQISKVELWSSQSFPGSLGGVSRQNKGADGRGEVRWAYLKLVWLIEQKANEMHVVFICPVLPEELESTVSFLGDLEFESKFWMTKLYANWT